MSTTVDKNRYNLREISLEILMEILENGVHVDTALHQTLKHYQELGRMERSFINRLVKGTVERVIELDYRIDACSTIRTKKMKPVIRQILRMSVYQMVYMEQVPDSAACNEAVKLVKKRKIYNLQGFVNGVLRAVSRQKDAFRFPDKGKDFALYLQIKYSLPSWLSGFFLSTYGKELAEKMAAYYLETSPLCVRYCGANEKQWQEKLESSGIKAVKSEGLSYAYRLYQIDKVEQIPGYAEGEFVVQDESSMLVAHVAGIKPGMKVLDICAAPGGKSLHSALLTGENGCVIARDLTSYKVDKIKENARRMKLHHIQAEVKDALVYMEEDKEKYDVVLADLPCSGLGVIGKKCDIKYNMSLKTMEELVLLQRDILKNAVDYVKPGGCLMYSTCTVNPSENEKQVEWILHNFPLRPVPLKESLPDFFAGDMGDECYLQLYPGVHQTDGFFLAKFQKD